MSDFLVKLQSYQLFTLQVRIYNKLLIFAHGIKTNARSPLELRSHLNSPVTPDIQTEENILPILGSYELRGRRVEKSVVPETKYETLTFKHFFPKLIKTFKVFDFSLRRDPFRLQINLNLNENLKTFLTSFPKFDIKFSAFHRKKMKKQSQKALQIRKHKKNRHHRTSLTLGCASHHGVKLRGVHPTTESSSAVFIATGSQADLSSEV